MSTDDIVFDEVKYREPKKARRPDRDRRWACATYEVPAPDDLPIFLDRKTADAIERHALRDTSVELGGIMLGHECVDDQTGQPYVWVTESLEAKHYENTQASFTYTHDSWEEITRERDRLHPDLDIVGWYHTHPDFGIFLSGHDLFIHRNFFAQPLQVAYVVDPIRQDRGFFRWKDGGLDRVGGYHITADRGDRVALARLVNDLESLPNAESGGGGLSPRLEAELIAMLSRPHQASTSSAADRAQVAALFGTLGLFGGILIVAAAAWLYTITQQIRDQTDSLAKLEKTVGRTDQVQEVALRTLLSNAQDPKRFVENFTRVEKDLEDAREALQREKRSAQLALDDNRQLGSRFEELRKKKQEADENLEKNKTEIEDTRAKVKERDREIEGIYKTDRGVLARQYTVTLYAAIGGWVIALLAVFGLLAIWASRTPPGDPEAPGPGPGPSLSPEPPHQIG